MTALQVLAIIFMIMGAVIIYGASFFVKRFSLEQKVKMGEAAELPENEWMTYRITKATAIVKGAGLVFLLPGVILVFFAF